MSLRERVAALPATVRVRRAGRRYLAQRGNHLASAVAFATVIAAAPLLMVLFSAAGFLFHARPDLLAELEYQLVGAFPAAVAEVVRPVVESAVASRAPVASIGTVAALWAGTAWIAVVREAIAAMWELPIRPPASPRRLLRDLGSLLMLLVALPLSVAATVTVAGGLDRFVPGALATAVGVLLGITISWAVLTGLLGRLPGRMLPLRRVAPVAAVGAVVLEVITVLTTVVVGATSGAVGVFSSVLAVLAFLFAGARVLLSLAAWLATSPPPGVRSPAADPTEHDDPTEPGEPIAAPTTEPR
ncbi:YhjD/YihY/BrkB family envelope integrity protein [Pseudonocardia sp. WMMC193]|uniref:YhjD/YihY/BrkB family envelope integrity protein n=1 Tax=Pseudonocardia sp. WMMC193 TaxID=2911965 RepID=UPI001F1A8267|nr:YhjD/YihY/BrkB family envelope integrity protein [Pseudonocardia sp. WMMC193]MCF7551347.1 YihY/virulence factor BrkB family protein [Pseudonocardia sp. WMMC193]